MFASILSAAAELPRTVLPPGATLIAEGDRPGRLFVLEDGVVEVSRAEVPVSTIDQPVAVFGDLAVLLDAPATATVRTRDLSRFRVCEDPEGFLRASPEVAVAIATMLARRLDALTRYLVDVRQQYAGREDHLGVVDVVLESLAHQQRAPAEPGSEREREAPY